MRSDMAKVIVERPRWGHRHGHIDEGRPRPLLDEDGLALGFFARTQKRSKKTKCLNENLAPLRRYLEAQVGRPWDKVYADICTHLKPTSTVQQHVRDHICDFVAVNTSIIDGEVVTVGRHGRPQRLSESHVRLYVDPRDGRVRALPHRRSWARRGKAQAAQAKAEASARMRELNEREQLHRFDDGCWWWVLLAKAPGESQGRFSATWLRWGPNDPGRSENEALDVVKRARLSRLPRWELYQRCGVIAVDKRQLSKKEKRAHGLR